MLHITAESVGVRKERSFHIGARVHDQTQGTGVMQNQRAGNESDAGSDTGNGSNAESEGRE